MSLPPPALFALKSVFEVGTTAVSLATAAGAASAQTEANGIATQNEITARNADYDQLHLMAQQDQAAAEQQIQENQIDTLQATERAQVAAGESGVSGLSVDALIADMWGRSAQFEDNVNQNLENRQQQIAFEGGNVDRRYQRTVSSLTPVEKPDYLGATLRAGSGIFGAYRDHLKIE